jgi:hypothetical protein
MNLLTEPNEVAQYPPHPTKSEEPRLFLRIEASSKAITDKTMTVYMVDSTGGRNFDLPINGDDLDASELTWAITKALRQWNAMAI